MVSKFIRNREKNIEKVVIERNKYHPTHFTKKVFSKGFQVHSSGYASILEEVISIYCPDLDRFTNKIKNKLMENIWKDINKLQNNLNKCMEEVRENSGKYTEKQILDLFKNGK